jgi:hypothetical protein
MYKWRGKYEIGDPVGLNKIEDKIWFSVENAWDIERFGYLVQKKAGLPFEIVDYNGVVEALDSIYILAGSPLFIKDSERVPLRHFNAYPLPPKEITPPGNLGHIFHDHPRTAVGIKPNGNLLFVTVDGRSPHSHGMIINELMGLMHLLGAETAMNLDGGGSTAMYLKRSANQPGSVINISPRCHHMTGNTIVLHDSELEESAELEESGKFEESDQHMKKLSLMGLFGRFLSRQKVRFLERFS